MLNTVSIGDLGESYAIMKFTQVQTIVSKPLTNNARYDLIIEHYEFAGNYLILLFHDTYDVITKTSDKNKLIILLKFIVFFITKLPL